MPTYVYRREDGTTFEILQPITADRLVACPTTNQPVRRVISGGTGFILKGSGFYKTDYADSAPPPSSNGKAKQKDVEDSEPAHKASAEDTSTQVKGAAK